jgi:hypothetical protein
VGVVDASQREAEEGEEGVYARRGEGDGEGERVFFCSLCLATASLHGGRQPTGANSLRLSTTFMSDKRRAEIEAKKAKLNELRKARAERQKAEAEKRQEVRSTRRPQPVCYLFISPRFSGPRRAKQMFLSSSIPSRGAQADGEAPTVGW